MKIRYSYVTNSSSSSFILGFNREEEIHNIENELPCHWSNRVIENIISDIEHGVTSKESAMEFYKEWIWPYNWKFRGRDYWNMHPDERESEEYKKFIEDKKVKYCKEFLDELNKYSIISIVEYEDHDDLGSELEHEIMPRLECTIERISHH